MRMRITVPVAALLLLTAAMSGCLFSPDKKDPPPPPPPEKLTSPEAVLRALQRAYLERDPALYDSLLYDDATATESFAFWFSDEDFQGGTVPENWGRDDEMASTTSLLTSDQVTSIQIRLTFGPSFYDNAIGHEGQKIINVTDVYLTVVDQPPGGVEATTYLVQGQRADFRFKVQWVDAGGDSLWRIIYWKDRGTGQGKRAPASIASAGDGLVRSLAEQARAQADRVARVEPARPRVVRDALFARKP